MDIGPLLLQAARRLTTLAAAASLIGLGGGLLAVGLGLAAPPVWAWAGVELSASALEAGPWTPIGAGMAAVGVLLAGVALWPAAGRLRGARVVLPTGLDGDGLTVRVSHRTLIRLVEHEARQVEGVRDVTPTIHLENGAWAIDCRLVVWRSLSMRDVSEQVTARLRDALHRHTGVNLAQLQIDVSLAHEPVGRTR